MPKPDRWPQQKKCRAGQEADVSALASSRDEALGRTHKASHSRASSQIDIYIVGPLTIGKGRRGEQSEKGIRLQTIFTIIDTSYTLLDRRSYNSGRKPMFGTYRTLLAIMLIFLHLGGMPVIGSFAVFGFYILSGYLMTLIMQNNYGYIRYIGYPV